MTHLDVRQLQRAHAAPVSDAPTTTLAQMPPRNGATAATAALNGDHTPAAATERRGG
jgi:hypothetical protein